MPKEFLSRLNKESYHNRHTMWQQHRDYVRNLVDTAIEGLDNIKETIILGAGSCDDLDLQFFSTTFDKIYLVDIDTESMNIALNRLSEKDKLKFVIKGDIDLTGLRELGFYEEFERLLKLGDSSDKIVEYIKKIKNKSYNENILPDLKNKFPLVISSAIFTQLCYGACIDILHRYLSLYSKEDIRDIILEISYLAVSRTEIYNELFVSLAQKNAKVVVWTDIIEITNKNRFLLNYHGNYKTLIEMAGEYNSIICGSIEGIKNLSKSLIVDNNYVFRQWVWPFSEEKEYYVCALIGALK